MCSDINDSSNKVASVRTCLSQSPRPPPLSRGRSGPAGFPSPQRQPCPPASARHLMMPCLNPPNPLFKGAIRACGLSIATRLPLLANSGPASEDAFVNSPNRCSSLGLCPKLLFLLIVVSQNVILSVKTRLLPDKLLISNNLSVKPHLFTDKLSILSQLFTVIGSWWRAG